MNLKKAKAPTIDRIVAYEQGELNWEETRALFQDLVNSGLAWELQGSYGRMAAAMLRAGEIKPPSA